MITISGIDVTPDNHLAPTLYDIGYHCSKLPRFGGATTGHWTVLHHLLAAFQYAVDWQPENRVLQLHAVLHDAHEAITGDMPKPWKTDDLRMLQADLDRRIFAGLGLSAPGLMTGRLVKQIDNQLAYNEAQVYAPQVAKVMLENPNFSEINPIDITGPRAVKAAGSWLTIMRFNAKKCGEAYEIIVKTLIEEMQHAKPATAPSPEPVEAGAGTGTV